MAFLSMVSSLDIMKWVTIKETCLISLSASVLCNTFSRSFSPNWNGDDNHGSVEANSQLSPRRARMIIAVKGADWRNDCDNKSGQTSPFLRGFSPLHSTTKLRHLAPPCFHYRPSWYNCTSARQELQTIADWFFFPLFLSNCSFESGEIGIGAKSAEKWSKRRSCDFPSWISYLDLARSARLMDVTLNSLRGQNRGKKT